MPFSPNRLYNLQTTGSNLNTWGIVLNSNFSIIDKNLGGTLPISVAGSSNVSLTGDQAQNLIHILSGILTGNIDYTFPQAGGFFFVTNNTTGAFSVTAKVFGSATGIVIPQGTTVPIYIDATVPSINGSLGTISNYTTGTITGTANALIATQTVPAGYTLRTNTSITVFPTAVNLGAATININNTGAIAIKKISPAGLVDLDIGDFAIGIPVILTYNGSVYIAINIIYEGRTTPVGANFALAFTDLFKMFVASTAITVTLAATVNYPPYFYSDFNAMSGDITITPNGTDTINGVNSNYFIPRGSSGRIYTNSAGAWYINFPGNKLNFESSLVSAATVDLGLAPSAVVVITGSTGPITSFGSAANVNNPIYFCRFTGTPTLTHNATSLILPSSANIVAANGDTMVAQYLGSGNWKVRDYLRQNGTSLVSSSVSYGSIFGCLPSAVAGTSTTASVSVGSGQATDSANTVYITSAGYSWSVTNGNAINGYQGGTTLPNSSTIHFFVCSGTSGTGSFASTSLTPTLPAGYTTAYRRVFSIPTTAAGALLSIQNNTELAGGSLICWLVTQILDVNVSNLGTSRTAYSLTVPTGIKVQPIIRVDAGTAGSTASLIITSLDETDVAPNASQPWGGAPGSDVNQASSFINAWTGFITTNTSAQIGARSSAATQLFQVVTRAWIDLRRG